MTTWNVVKAGGDVSALGVLAGWFVGVLPTIATLFTVIWFGILITEKVTGRAFVELIRCASARFKKLFTRS